MVDSFAQLRPEGRNTRREPRFRGSEVLGPLRGLGIRPSREALQGPRRGVSVFKGAGKEGGPLRGPQEAPFSRMPPEGVPTLGFLPSGHRCFAFLLLEFSGAFGASKGNIMLAKQRSGTPGAVVVNFGEALSIITSGAVKSTTHRVVSPPQSKMEGEHQSTERFPGLGNTL